MDLDDSDSSMSDPLSEDFTNVLLGFASRHETDDAFSQLGGEPSWLDVTQNPPPALAQCKNCSTYMTLLLQLNGDLPNSFPNHERRLYVWSCIRKPCRRKPNSIRAFRGTRISVASNGQSPLLQDSKSKAQDIGAELFGAKPRADLSSNPFSTTTSASTNPFASAPAPPSTLAAKPPQPPSSTDSSSTLPETFAQKARISTPTSTPLSPEPAAAWPPSTAFPAPYPSFHLDAEYEYLSPSSTPQPTDTTAFPIDLPDDPPSSSTTDAAGDTDSAQDRAFQHFSQRVAQNADQVLRYEYGGMPLLYSRTDAVGRLFAPPSATGKVATTAAAQGIPRCNACGAERVFELQLMPHAIAELEADEEGPYVKRDVATLLGEGMEWGTIILGVCSRDCGGPADGATVVYREEWVGVQWEEQLAVGRVGLGDAAATAAAAGDGQKGKGKNK